MAGTTSIGAQLFSDLKRDFGLTNEQAAGVVGNFMHESGGFNSLQEVSPTTGRGGFGYAQWTGPRREAFESYVERTGLDPSSYAANYGFLRHELATDRYERKQFNKVKKATTAAEAARIISEEYLRPGTPRIGARTQLAKEAMAFADMPVPPRDLNYGVGTLTDTVPARIPAPVTPSPDMAALRARAYVPSNLVADSFARVQPRTAPQRRAADLAAMDRQQVAPILQRNGKLVDPAEVILYGKNPDYLSIGSLPTRQTASPKAAPRTIAEIARIYAGGGPTRPPADQIGIANTGRPMLDNGDGSFSTELAITVTDSRINDGRPTNIPTIWGGRRLSEEQAINTARASGQKFQSFPSIPAAVAAAEYHSANDIGPATRSAPAMPTRASQSYAGQDRALVTSRPAPAPVQQSSQLLGRRTAASVPAAQEAANRVAAASRPPARLPELPPSSLDRNPVYFDPGDTGQRANGRSVASIPTVSRSSFSDDPGTPASGQVVASIPTSVGQPPTTRTVQTTTVRPQSNVSQARAEQSVQRQVAPPVSRTASIPASAPRIDDIGYGVSWAELTGTLGNPDRLPASAEGLPANFGTISPGQVATIGAGLSGQVNPLGQRIASAAPTPLPRNSRPVAQAAPVRVASAAPVPLPASARPNGVATQLAVTPPPSPVAPVPFDRPNFGIGGPDPLPQPINAPQLAAPTPIGNPLQPEPNLLQQLISLHPAVRAFNAIGGGNLGKRIGPVGASLGVAANGGNLVQGVNGIVNSLTSRETYNDLVNAGRNRSGNPMSSLERIHSGRDNRYTSNGDGSFESASGGKYYDRHIS